MSRTRPFFTVLPLYRRKPRSIVLHIKQHLSFFIAMLTLVAFVAGNMVGQQGWYTFWTGMMGKEADIVFTGMVPPVAFVPNYPVWTQNGGNPWKDAFSSVPSSMRVPLPPYDPAALAQRGERLTFAQVIYGFGGYAEGYSDVDGSHPGIDIRMPEGTPVQAIANASVEKVGYNAGGFGNYIVLKHPNVPKKEGSAETETLYSVSAHLSKVSVPEGAIIQKGQEIGLSGSTGLASGPHLHFQIDNDKAPWHPYWPFTPSEANAAHLSFSEAVDAGLGRENVLLYTRNPMLLVNGYLNYSSPVTVAANTLQNATKATARSYASLSAAERRQVRMAQASAKSALTSRTVVAYDDTVHAAASEPTASVTPSPQASSASSIAVSTPPKPIDRNANQVAGFSLRVDSSTPFICGKDSTVVVYVTAQDANSEKIDNPKQFGTVYVRPEFGTADIEPSSFTASRMQQGVTRIIIKLPSSGKNSFIFSLISPTLGTTKGPLITCQK